MPETMRGGRSPRGRVGSSRLGFVLLVVAVIALSACSNSQNSKASGAASSQTAPARNAATAGANANLPKGQPLTTPRQIVYTADLNVRVTDVGPASTRAVSIVESTGGYVFSQDANLTDRAETTLVFKVPPDQFSRVLDRLADLGTPLEKNLSASDVTDQVVDLEGRLKTATASATRLRALLSGAGNVPDIVAIEHELATRESEVESLQGQLRLVQSRVQLATVTLVLTTKAPHEAGIPGFSKALSNGWKAFANTGRVTLAVIGAALPFAALAGFIAMIAVIARRRRRPASLQTP
jgi:hypothetical protein